MCVYYCRTYGNAAPLFLQGNFFFTRKNSMKGFFTKGNFFVSGTGNVPVVNCNPSSSRAHAPLGALATPPPLCGREREKPGDGRRRTLPRRSISFFGCLFWSRCKQPRDHSRACIANASRARTKKENSMSVSVRLCVRAPVRDFT